jgi:5-methylcytosine-specific restriction endonuclease McrA
MPIADQNIKKLWGLAAGRCARPDCGTDCVRFFGADPTVLGEMAHIIARQPTGRRGVPGGGSNAYENLILLCPTNHTEIDKAPEGTFPVALLHGWKDAHERRVREALEA